MESNCEFDASVEFGEKTAEELINEFLDECPVSDDTYISFFGAYYSVLRKMRPASKDIFMWMVFNSDLDRGRVVMQSLSIQRMMRELGISEVTYFKCLRDLKKLDVIRGCNAEYFINPRFAWRGCEKRRRMFINKYPHVDNERPRNVSK